MKRRAWLAAISLIIACTTHETAPPTESTPSPSDVPECAIETKSCGGVCVSTTEPATGCAASTCAPCSVAHAGAACTEGSCAVAACENGWGDCNRAAIDGCETSLLGSAAHCGSCDLACPNDHVCRTGICVDKAVADAEQWLATQNAGFCLDAYNKLLNLCGDVEFCFDKRFMRAYPNGIAIDVGFTWGSELGNLVSLGGDCSGKSLMLSIEMRDVGGKSVPILLAAMTNQIVATPIAPGKHLASVQLNPLGLRLFLDGIEVSAAGPPSTNELLDACGPGMIVGQRISYWWEAVTRAPWLQAAIFLVHLREGIVDTKSYSVEAATTPQPNTVLLFDTTGIDGSRWTAHIGGLVAVGKNAQDETPQVDAAASGPLPVWKPLAECPIE